LTAGTTYSFAWNYVSTDYGQQDSIDSYTRSSNRRF